VFFSVSASPDGGKFPECLDCSCAGCAVGVGFDCGPDVLGDSSLEEV
jgi:hypothetical protein